MTTKQKIYLLLVNTKDHELPKRVILQRIQYRLDFQAVYHDWLARGILTEYGTGKKGSTCVVRLTGRNITDEVSQNV